MRKILAIESTCDETSAAVVLEDGDRIEILSNVVASSSEMHVKYGGIVPEVAAREQVKVLVPVVSEAMGKAGVTKDDLDAVAVASGPGLMGSLLIGVESAKALAMAWGKQLITVNHMKAHVLANWIGERPMLPAIALVVSGGHTDLYLIKKIDEWQWIGGTRDDAAGECFDKCSRALSLPYPGGPSIQKAAEGVSGKSNFVLPRPMLNQDNLEMSFSGLKAAVVNTVDELGELDEEKVGQLAKEINEAIVEVLVEKTKKAVELYSPKSVLLAGGVAANKLLRAELEKMSSEMGVGLYTPEFKYCTDNAGMIGAAALVDKCAGFVDKGILSVRAEVGLEI